jgi:hypothetical protein
LGPCTLQNTCQGCSVTLKLTAHYRLDLCELVAECKRWLFIGSRWITTGTRVKYTPQSKDGGAAYTQRKFDKCRMLRLRMLRRKLECRHGRRRCSRLECSVLEFTCALGSNICEAVSLPLHRDTKFVHQRLRWLTHGRYQRIRTVPHVLWLRFERRHAGYGHRIRHLHYWELGRIVCRRTSNRFSRKEMGHVHRLLHHHGRHMCPSHMYQPRRVHGWSLRLGIRSRHHFDRRARIC